MAIELVGERKAVEALGVEAATFKSGGPNSPSILRSRYASVSIPDIRFHNYSETVQKNTNVRSSADQTNQLRQKIETADTHPNNEAKVEKTGQRILTSLQSIKASIENQTVQSTDSLVDELSKVDNREKTVDDSKLEFTPKLSKDCFLSRLNANDRQIIPIAESILGKFPLGGTSIIAFTGTERNEQLEMVVAGTALTMSHLKKCKVLVIDSEVNNGFLTELMSAESKVGLTDLAQGGCTWQQALEPTCQEDVHFLPLGHNESIFPEKMASVLKKAIPNVIGNYDYVIVNVGDVHDSVAELWSNYTNGTFLVVSMMETNQSIAKSAVAQLNSFGARLVGCVVSDTLS